jgi:hypothetical protein
MNKISFSFIKNKLFLAGFISGVLITAVAFILIISSDYQAPEKNKLKGTMAGSYKPAVGEKGTAQSWGLDCGNKLGSCEVIFDNDRAHNYVHCHYQGSATRVEVVSVTDGDFCAGGGVTVQAATSQY